MLLEQNYAENHKITETTGENFLQSMVHRAMIRYNPQNEEFRLRLKPVTFMVESLEH